MDVGQALVLIALGVLTGGLAVVFLFILTSRSRRSRLRRLLEDDEDR